MKNYCCIFVTFPTGFLSAKFDIKGFTSLNMLKYNIYSLKSRIRETKHLSPDANTPKPIFF